MQARGVSWCDDETAVLDRCGLEISRGSWAALIGPNGAGKSTLLQLLAGTWGFPQSHFRGEISWQGRDWLTFKSRERAQKVAYVGSDLDPAFPLSVEEVVQSGVFASGNCLNIEAALEFCLISSMRKKLVHKLSGGERQRVALARALVQGARVLFLDEALSKMDIDHQLDFGSRLKALLSADPRQPFALDSVVLVSHDFTFGLRWADQAIVLAGGKVVGSGVPSQVLTPELLQLIYPRAAPELLLEGVQK